MIRRAGSWWKGSLWTPFLLAAVRLIQFVILDWWGSFGEVLPNLFIMETSFRYCDYSCLRNFRLLQKLLRVPTLWKHLCMLHFAKAWKSSILAQHQQITWHHDRNFNKSQLVMSRYIVFHSVENDVGIVMQFVISKKVSRFQITLKLLRNHKLNNCTQMDILLIRLCPRPSNPNTIWKLRLSAFTLNLQVRY
jgi:hypothetical protein